MTQNLKGVMGPAHHCKNNKKEMYIRWSTFLGNHQWANPPLPVTDGVICHMEPSDITDLYHFMYSLYSTGFSSWVD